MDTRHAFRNLLLPLTLAGDRVQVVRPLDAHPRACFCAEDRVGAARLGDGEREEVLGEDDFRRGERGERDAEEERELEASGGKPELEKELVGMLKKGETVLEALQRLGSKSKKATPKLKK